MIFSRAWFALMRRNFIYRRRNWIGTVLELFLPLFFMGAILAIKIAVENTGGLEPTKIDPNIPDDSEVFQPLSFTDYVLAMGEERQCVPGLSGGFDISGMPRRGVPSMEWQVPMIKCDPRRCTNVGQDALPLCQYSILALVGEDAISKKRAEDMRDFIYDEWPAIRDIERDQVGFELIQMFNSSKAIDDYVRSRQYGEDTKPKIAMGVVWTAGNDENNYLYSLRQNSTNFNTPSEEGRPATSTTPDTKSLFNNYARRDDVCTPEDGTAYQGRLGFSCTGQYMYNGVLTFQRLVHDFIIHDTGAAANGFRVADGGVRYVRFPARGYVEEGFYGAIGVAAPLLIILGLLYPVAAMVGYITREKEYRQKELMKMMSVTESDINWAWFATFMLLNVFNATFVTMISNQVYENSENFLKWIWWMFVFLSITVFSMAMASIFSKSTRAIVLSLLVYLIGFFAAIAIDYTTVSRSISQLVGLHPIAALSFGLQEIGRLEDLGAGVNSNTINQTDSSSGYTFGTALGSLVFDSIFWGIMTWYLNRVIRPDYGQALPLYFPFTVGYWCPSRAVSSSDNGNNEAFENPEEVPVEPVSDAMRRQSDLGENIQIRGLTKVFGEHAAVDGLNLTMYSGQITALLGHNGAGKTTTISMLTGALAPTSGTAIVTGKDIRTQMSLIRQDIGICLQHDCLFPQLTVREHVEFFSRLKGLYSKVSKSEADEMVDQAIKDVALFEKRHTFSRNLSGGMKRKLSVAMAFCGGSKVVLLDEPTSGMDPFSRRFTWNVIRQYRRDRCIILTTHFMDEADILGDRIAIMSEGQLRCTGSPLFLKKTYGVGYQLTIEKAKQERGSVYDSNCSDEQLMGIVTSSVPESTLLTNVGSELSYQLPMSAASKFVPMFEGLEQQMESGNISSYGVSITTLDEVFLLVARGETHSKKDFASSRRMARTDDVAANVIVEEETSTSHRSKMDLEADGLFLRHVDALFKKRVSFFKRDKKAWLCTAVVPCFFVFIGLLITKYASPSRNMESLTLDFERYNVNAPNPRNPIFYNSPDETFSCEPGNCAYYEWGSSESARFCGSYGRLKDPSLQCSISKSRMIVEQVVDADSAATEIDVSTVSSASNQLFETLDTFTASRFGALLFTFDNSSVITEDIISYNDAVMANCMENIADFKFLTVDDCRRLLGLGYVIQYNFTALHVSPLFQVLADEAIVREGTGNPDINIQAKIAPLPITKVEESFGDAEDSFLAWFLSVFGFPFIGAAFASFVVAERESKAKHLQTVAGVHASAYWISTFIWDFLNYQIPMWITVMLMFGFDVNTLTTTRSDVLSGVIAIMLLYGSASAGFAYCVSYGFKSPAICSIVIILSGFLIGMGGPMTIFVLRLIGNDLESPKKNLLDAADILAWCLRWFPSFCFGQGLFSAINVEIYRFFEQDPNLSVWHKSVLLYDVIALGVQTIVYLGLAVALDIGSSKPCVMAVWQSIVDIITLRWLTGSGGGIDITIALPDDDDVLAEQDRVLRGEANNDLIVVNQLTKIYSNGKVAVNNLSLGIPPGECFGLLGINGAGKTTTMCMLTAEFPPTSGDATLAGYSVAYEPEKTRRRIGYCPQFDAHFANLTGREHVELYASIKGVPREFVREAASAKLHEVGLSEFDSDRVAAGYSGGMKRRLSLACATIGQPQIVFLDECSTGVDPVARREIWQLISDMVSGKNVEEHERASVVLTTHSMEECEALCPRIGIMANGRLRCLGSAQRLKSKFGQGFQVELKCKVVDRDDEDYVAVVDSLRSSLYAMRHSSAEELDDIALNENETRNTLQALSGDSFLADMINSTNPNGYQIWKEASSPVGVQLDALAAFAAIELRMRNVDNFVRVNYPKHVLRERQDNKVRYEVNSQGVRISNIFGNIEANKATLWLSDYGVGQTSLEQVFNMHAAEAEKLKDGRNDG